MTESVTTTREGIEVRPGQIWQDLDKRQDNRRVLVIAVNGGKATVQPAAGGHKTRISISRMHAHSTGFKLVAGPGFTPKSTTTTESETSA